MSEERRIENIPIHKIIPNIYQPRIKFDDKALSELSNSIKSHGIIQPLILRKIGKSYEIIDGERRYKAAKKIGLETVPSIILDIDDKEAAELILTENMQKKLLTPIEEANAYQQIMLLNKYDLEELSEKLEKDKIYIENKLKLLTLAPEIQEALLNNKIAEGHAKALTKITNKEKQIELYNKILKERIPVKALEDLIIKEQKDEDEKDKISLNDLNKRDYKKEEKKNKLEEEKMDNTQMNFNQYNNLLKEQNNIEMGTISQPEAIIGNNITEPKANEFFPSLEEQPLNMEVPFNNETENIGANQIPQFEMPAAPQMAPEQPMMQPEITSFVPNPMPGPMEIPQFEMPAAPQMVPEQPMMQPEMPSFTQNPMPGPMGMPQFEMPAAPQMVPEQPMMQPEMPSFAQNPMPGPIEMPQFEMPAAPQMAADQPMMQPEMPSFAPNPMPGPMENPTLQNQIVMTNVMPAVNMIRNLIPLLENSGYKINIEEADNIGEYQITLKVQK